MAARRFESWFKAAAAALDPERTFERRLEPDDDPDRFAHRNVTISKIRRIDGRTQLRYMSCLSHLDDDMVTW